MRALLALALLVGSCGSEPEPEGVLFSGCRAVLPGRVCWSPEGTATVWVAAGVATPTIDRGALTLVDDGGGRRFQVQAEDGATVEVRERGVWRMKVVRDVPGVDGCVEQGPDVVALEAGPRGVCLARRASKRFEAAGPGESVAAYEVAASVLRGSGWERERQMAQARLAWVKSDVAGGEGGVVEEPLDPSDGQLGYMTAYARAQSAAALGDHRAALMQYRRSLSFAERMESPERIAEMAERVAVVEARLGRLERAVEHYRAALAIPSTRQCWAGDRALAAAWGQLLLAEVGLEGAQGIASPAELLQRADQEHEMGGAACEGRGRPADRAVDHALLALRQGDLAQVDTWLDRAEGLQRNEDTERWMYALRGRLLLAKGEPDGARTTWRLVSELAERAGDMEMRWRALDGLALAALSEGDQEQALQVLESGRRLFASHAALVPLRQGRGLFLAQRSPLVAAHVRTLLDLGRPAEAFDTARGWRSQLLATTWLVDRIAGLDDTGRKTWEGVVRDIDTLRKERTRLLDARRGAPSDELPRIEAELSRLDLQEGEVLDTGVTALSVGYTGELRALAPGEAMVVVAPAPRPVFAAGDWSRWARDATAGEPGWIALLQDGRGVAVGSWTSDAEVRRRPGVLLDAFLPRLAAAERVTLMVPGAIDGLDLHMAPVDGVPLALRVPVSWSVDRSANAVTPPAGAARRAVVVADPGGGLESARAEGVEVAAALRARGWEVTELGRGTTLPALLRALGQEGVELLHYAGHGEVKDDAWDARLVLAEGTSLTVRDVLALQRPPRTVILAGCETGKTERIGLAGMGLAQAFVAAGSETVLATARKVDDTLAREISLAWYAAVPEQVGALPAWRSAVAAVATARPDADWAGFRLVVR
jgi:tetratricopeptide (TPR) repeat protein